MSKKCKRSMVTRRYQARKLRRQLDEAEAGLHARGAIRADALE